MAYHFVPFASSLDLSRVPANKNNFDQPPLRYHISLETQTLELPYFWYIKYYVVIRSLCI